MPGVSNLTNIWNNIKEVDLRPIRDEALTMIKIAIAGAPNSGREALADQLRLDPSNPNIESQAPVLILDLDNPDAAAQADLIILMLNASGQPEPGRFERERDLARRWSSQDKRLLVFVNQPAELGKAQAYGPWIEWGHQRVIYGTVDNAAELLTEFVPAVIELLPDKLLSLGRHFPLFRVAVANHLINETSFSNAAYSLSTGLAEIVPVFDIPLNVADMFVLSKAQAFLVYRLGLALGLSTRWQDYVAEFGSVLGGGFLWRQMARSLVGLIPVWGIVPKVAVAYSGTYVVGHTVLRWYLQGRHVSPQQMRELSRQAFARGKLMAQNLTAKIPRPRFGRRRKPAELPPPEIVLAPEISAADDGGALPAQITAGTPAERTCPQCGRSNVPDARFCAYCASPLEAQAAG